MFTLDLAYGTPKIYFHSALPNLYTQFTKIPEKTPPPVWCLCYYACYNCGGTKWVAVGPVVADSATVNVELYFNYNK